MMPDSIFSKPLERLLVLGFDMDGCLVDDFLYPGLASNHRFAINAMQRILLLVDARSYDEIVVRPATNRKDKTSDENNAHSQHTPLTGEALRTVYQVLSSLLHDSDVRVSLDLRLHVDQLFPSDEPDAPSEYSDQVVKMLALCDGALTVDDVNQSLFSKQSNEAVDKVDIVMALAYQYADDPERKVVTMAMIDDRFFTDAEEEVKSLHAMMQFFASHSHYLPSNLTLMAVRMDPYVIKDALDDRCNAIQVMRTFMKDCISTLGDLECIDIWSQLVTEASDHDCVLENYSFDSLTSYILSSDIDYRAAIDIDESLLTRLECCLFDCLVTDNPFRTQAFNDELLNARLSYLDTLSNEAQEDFLVDMIDITHTCSGSFPRSLSVTSEVFWTTCLVPAALAYRRYLKNSELEDNLVTAVSSPASLSSC